MIYNFYKFDKDTQTIKGNNVIPSNWYLEIPNILENTLVKIKKRF